MKITIRTLPFSPIGDVVCIVASGLADSVRTTGIQVKAIRVAYARTQINIVMPPMILRHSSAQVGTTPLRFGNIGWPRVQRCQALGGGWKAITISLEVVQRH